MCVVRTPYAVVRIIELSVRALKDFRVIQHLNKDVSEFQAHVVHPSIVQTNTFAFPVYVNASAKIKAIVPKENVVKMDCASRCVMETVIVCPVNYV